METQETTPQHRLLAVLAHPDDESFGMGGTLALYARRGASVHLICATRGEAGMVDDHHLDGFASIAERRVNELRCAAAQLGLAGVYFLGYRDSGMPGSADNQHGKALINAPLEEVAAQVAAQIRKIKPQVVLTFDPIGGYKHPDHIAIHQATVLAFNLAGDASFTSDDPPFQAQKLYFHVMPKRFLKFAVKVLPLLGKDPHHFGRNGDINLAELAEEGDFPIHAQIDYRPVSKIKETAALCHASQLEGMGLRRGPMRWAQTLFGQRDSFMRAFPPGEIGLKETDLLVGV